MKITRLACKIAALTLTLAGGSWLAAQVQTIVPPVVPGAKPVTVEHIKVHGKSLEGNLEGDAVDRDVIVFLPPSYDTDKHRRYPVVYALHGYSIGAEQWTHEIHVPQTIEGAFAQGAKEMIVVLPDSKTMHNGSMYSSSVTTGDFEQFICARCGRIYRRSLPHDSRTRRAAGLVGHSMGGYGASRIGMKHADVFGSALHHEPLLHVADGRRRTGRSRPDERAGDGQRKEGCGGQVSSRSGAHSPGFGALSLPPPPRGRPIPRTRRCISICRRRMAWRAGRCWRNGRRTLRWLSSISISAICGSTGQSRSTWATRMVCGSMPASCTRFWTVTESRTASKSIRHPHQRRGRPIPEPRDAILQQEPVCDGKMQVNLANGEPENSCKPLRIGV